MADLRVQILLDNMGARLFRSPAWTTAAVGLKLAVRRFVIATADTPLGFLYHAIYRAHVWYGVRAIRRLPGVRAIYVTRGVASGEIIPGVSDVDFAVFGDWTDAEHARVSDALRRLSATSPLFERELWREARTVSSIRSLFDSDYSLMCRLDEGRIRWSLQYGEDVLANLPPPPPERLAGGYYMELRLWWSYFTRTAFGSDVLATDAVFQNSLCYKVVAETLAKVHALAGAPVEPLRRRALAAALGTAAPGDRSFLERLQRSARGRHRAFEGRVHDETFGFLLATLDRVHDSLFRMPAFAPVPADGPLTIDAPPAEVLRTPELQDHAARLVDQARRQWRGYRAAFLVPCASFYAPDDLILLFDVDPAARPSVEDVRALLRQHAARSGPVRQRLTLMLLAGDSAWQIEAAGPLDLWHLVMGRASNPEVFELLTRDAFVLDGPPRPPAAPVVWTRFAAALVDEELAVRRSAAAQASTGVDWPALDLLRGVWRYLQLHAIAVSTAEGRPSMPLTPAAIARAVAPLDLLDRRLLAELADAYAAALAGAPISISQHTMRLIDMMANAHPEAAAIAQPVGIGRT